MVLPNPDTTLKDLPPGTPWLANTTIAEQLLRYHIITGPKVWGTIALKESYMAD